MKLTPSQLRDMGYDPDDTSPVLRRKPILTSNTATFSHFDDQRGVHIPPKSPKRLKQSQRPLLNKLEMDFYEHLRHQFRIILSQSIRFKLGNGIWFKVDFIAIPTGLESQDTRWRAFEVKGPHAFRGGFENLKVAAHQYPFIKWILTWKENGKWVEQLILP